MVPGDHGELARVERAGSKGLAEIVEAQAARIRQAELADALQIQHTHLSGFPQSEVASVLLQAQDEWNVAVYEEACRELARLGCAFVRIRDSLFFRDRATATASVFARLEQLGIEPLGSEESAADDADSSTIVDRIRRRAEFLRLQWREENQSQTHEP